MQLSLELFSAAMDKHVKRLEMVSKLDSFKRVGNCQEATEVALCSEYCKESEPNAQNKCNKYADACYKYEISARVLKQLR